MKNDEHIFVTHIFQKVIFECSQKREIVQVQVLVADMRKSVRSIFAENTFICACVLFPVIRNLNYLFLWQSTAIRFTRVSIIVKNVTSKYNFATSTTTVHVSIKFGEATFSPLIWIRWIQKWLAIVVSKLFRSYLVLQRIFKFSAWDVQFKLKIVYCLFSCSCIIPYSLITISVFVRWNFV